MFKGEVQPLDQLPRCHDVDGTVKCVYMHVLGAEVLGSVDDKLTGGCHAVVIRGHSREHTQSGPLDPTSQTDPTPGRCIYACARCLRV